MRIYHKILYYVILYNKVVMWPPLKKDGPLHRELLYCIYYHSFNWIKNSYLLQLRRFAVSNRI